MPVPTDAVALMVPSGTDLRSLARAWFPDADWLREARAPRPARAMAGARFRGAPASEDRGALGLVALAPGALVVGPLPAGRDSVELWWVTSSPTPEGDGAAARSWASATAVHAGGSVGAPGVATLAALVTAVERVSASPDGEADELLRETSDAALREVLERGLVRPGSARAAWRVLYSPLIADVQLGFDVLVRHGLRAGLLERAEPGGLVSAVGFTLVGRTAYDGAVVLRMARAEVEPPALRELPWRSHGPFAYELSWRPEEAEGDIVDSIALRRIAPTIQRLALALRDVCTGTILTGDGFVAD